MLKLVTLEEFFEQIKEIEGFDIIVHEGLYRLFKSVDSVYPGVDATIYLPSYERNPLPPNSTETDLKKVVMPYINSRVVLLHRHDDILE